MNEALWEEVHKILLNQHEVALNEIKALIVAPPAECADGKKGKSSRPEELISPYLEHDMDRVPWVRQASTESTFPSFLHDSPVSSLPSPMRRTQTMANVQQMVDNCSHQQHPLREMYKKVRRVMSSSICFDCSAQSQSSNMLQKLVGSRYFETSVIFVILLNFTYTIYDTNWQMQHRTDATTQTMQIIEQTFIWIYFAELLTKVIAFRSKFFIGADMGWNIFDFVLVLMGLFEVLAANSTTNVVNPSFARIVRMLKTLRKVSGFVRMMHFFPELRLMIKCISGSLGSLFWCIVILFGIMLCFAVLFVQQMTWYVIESQTFLSESEEEEISAGFGSVQQGTFSLFMFFAGGAEWGDAYLLIKKSGTFASIAFVTYILLMWISLHNIIASIYVDKALKYAQCDSNDHLLKAGEEALATARHLKDIFKSMDEDGSGTLSLSELQECLEDVRVTTLLGIQGIQIKDVESFFDTMSTACGSAEIDMETFVMGCLNMRGPASSMDLFAIGYKLQLQLSHCSLVLDRLGTTVQTIAMSVTEKPNTCRLPLFDRAGYPTSNKSFGRL